MYNIPYKVLTQGLDPRITDENIIVLSSILNYHSGYENVVLFNWDAKDEDTENRNCKHYNYSVIFWKFYQERC